VPSLKSVAHLVLALAGSACAGCTGPRDDVVTWAHVRPLLETSCLECHAAEFATYQGARDNAHAMLAMVEAQLMPPGGIDRSGACNTFEGPRPLRDDEIALLRSWIDDGLIGPASADIDGPPDPPETIENGVTASLAIAAGDDETQRCFVVHVGARGFLTGVSLRAPRVVHHAMVFTVDDAATLPDANGEAWPCDGVPRASSGESASLAFAWTPGRNAVLFPEETGVALTSRVIVQVHEYGALAEGDARVAELTLGVSEHVERALTIVPVAHAGFSLAPGAPLVDVTRPVSLPAGDVVGVMPHLHVAGRALSLRSSDGSSDDGACIVDAPRYDFAFQEVAFFTSALHVEPATTGTLTCTWDTTDRTAPTRWGEGSLDEMCTAFLFVAAS
jgi:hypothetical protein